MRERSCFWAFQIYAVSASIILGIEVNKALFFATFFILQAIYFAMCAANGGIKKP